MIALQPNFREVREPSVLGDFVWGQVIVEIKNRFVFRVIVEQADSLRISQKKMVVNKAHQRLVDFDSYLPDLAVKRE